MQLEADCCCCCAVALSFGWEDSSARKGSCVQGTRCDGCCPVLTVTAAPHNCHAGQRQCAAQPGLRP